MKIDSCMWYRWCLETRLDKDFNAAALRTALEHLKQAAQEYPVEAWVLSSDRTESFVFQEILSLLPEMKEMLLKTRICRLAIVTSHVFGEMARGEIQERLGIKTYLFKNREFASEWFEKGCPA